VRAASSQPSAAAPRVWVGAITTDRNHPMSPHRLNSVSPATAALARLAEVNGLGWLLGVVVAIASALLTPLFAPLFFLCVIFSMADYHWGKRVVQELARVDPTRHRYEPALAQLGWQSKMIGLLVLLGVRGFEWWALQNSVGDVPGLASVVVGVAYLKHELDSLNTNSQRIGKKIPGISHVLAFMEAVELRLRPPPPAPVAPAAPAPSPPSEEDHG
jgi:hypothetical protein